IRGDLRVLSLYTQGSDLPRLMHLHKTLRFLALFSFTRGIDAFVYSCDEVLYELTDPEFEQYAKYAYVVKKEGFTNDYQLKKLYLEVNGKSHSLADIDEDGLVNENENAPWKVTIAHDVDIKCTQEFILILKSDDLPVFQPHISVSSETITAKLVHAMSQSFIDIRLNHRNYLHL
ncbi:hypothetical protein PMAYCL1PPCAC_03983, partial [Pristionchus mayeri]